MLKRVIKYFERLGIAISVLFNVILGGPSNQTFSARNYAWKRDGKPNIVWFIDTIFFWEPDHSLLSWLFWIVRKDVIHEMSKEKTGG